jgi:hypothetical protein
VISGRRNGQYRVPVSPDLKASDLFGNPCPAPAEYKGYLLYVDSSLPAKALATAIVAK